MRSYNTQAYMFASWSSNAVQAYTYAEKRQCREVKELLIKEDPNSEETYEAIARGFIEAGWFSAGEARETLEMLFLSWEKQPFLPGGQKETEAQFAIRRIRPLIREISKQVNHDFSLAELCSFSNRELHWLVSDILEKRASVFKTPTASLLTTTIFQQKKPLQIDIPEKIPSDKSEQKRPLLERQRSRRHSLGSLA